MIKYKKQNIYNKYVLSMLGRNYSHVFQIRHYLIWIFNSVKAKIKLFLYNVSLKMFSSYGMKQKRMTYLLPYYLYVCIYYWMLCFVICSDGFAAIHSYQKWKLTSHFHIVLCVALTISGIIFTKQKSIMNMCLTCPTLFLAKKFCCVQSQNASNKRKQKQ